MNRARDEMMELAESFSLTTPFSEEVMAEVDHHLKQDGLEDPRLADATGLPFVTIDNEDSRDLDQALFIERLAGGAHRVHYALADASFYVRPGSALMAESLRRGASYYLPGFVAPMLPVELSEGLVSLNPEVLRRAVVFVVDLDPAGEVVALRVERQRIRSRAKLTYRGVQELWDDLDAGRENHLENRDFSPSLFALREVGRRRIELAEAGGVVHYPRIEVDVGFADPEGRSFVAFESKRYECDRANEQLSLLVNVEGAKLLERHARPDPTIAAVYRVHPAPEPDTLLALADTSRQVMARHGLDPALSWQDDEPLSRWIARLGQALGRHPAALALQRQALLVNQRSSFAPEPGLHYGVGAPCYARFSSPMREVVGIHTHREALEALGLEPAVAEVPGEREAIVEAANRAKDLQHLLTKRSNQLALTGLLAPDLERPEAQRPRRLGTVLGLGHDRLFVLLDGPPLEVKVYARDLGERTKLETDALLVDGRPYALGARVELVVLGFDRKRDRFALSARLV